MTMTMLNMKKQIQKLSKHFLVEEKVKKEKQKEVKEKKK